MPASRVQLHTQNLDLPSRVHSVPELRQGATQETQTEDLYRQTCQWSHGSRVGQRPASCPRAISNTSAVRLREWHKEGIERKWVSQRRRKLGVERKKKDEHNKTWLSVEIALWLGPWVFQLRGCGESSCCLIVHGHTLYKSEVCHYTGTHTHWHDPWQLLYFLPWRSVHVIIGFLYETPSAEGTSLTRKPTKVAAAVYSVSQ